LSLVVPITHPLIGIALILFLAMALTPFVNNATVAIVLTPIALEFARAGRKIVILAHLAAIVVRQFREMGFGENSHGARLSLIIG
ncbi:cation transporter, partial [Rhizobium ruizarguesonis]